MKKSQTRRILLLLGCAVLLVCLSVGATLAYLTSKTDVVTNTFTVGNVQITLDEAKVDVYGKVLTGEDAGRGTSNTYKLIPGHEYTKDPTIHVAAGSENCYLFVKVEDGIIDIQDNDKIAAQMTKNGWTLLDNTKYPNVYYYKDPVNALNNAVDVPVFGSFKLTGEAEVEKYDGKTITVQAYAVQADGFGTAAAAYEAAPCTWGKTTSTTPDTPANPNP